MPKKDQTEAEPEDNETEEAMPKKAAPEVAPSTEGLVKVVHGDEVLFVHPTALADHQKLGWKEA